ncbi:hypothetical protein L7F22_008473 [Adiantum nelumboides]|nr:hypothetical protein [Adiantum nelumboides]
MAEEKAGSLLIFDFDHSLIDCNSDPWVVDHLGASQLMLSLRPLIPSWTHLMDRMMEELAASGRTVHDIEDALRQIPVHPAMIKSIKAAHSWGWEAQIISDANSFFIQTILTAHDLDSYFSEIHTNQAQVDERGVLRIGPYQRPPPHKCPLCPPNMCKGAILDSVRAASQLPRQRTIYIGDGGGDYCPSVRLREADHVLAREGFPLLRLIEKNPGAVKATVHKWSTALDVERCLIQLYETDQNSS